MNIPVDWAIVGPAVDRWHRRAGRAAGRCVLPAAYVAGLRVAVERRTRRWAGLRAVPRSHGRHRPASPFALSLIILGGTLVVVVASNVMNFENAMPPGEYHFLLLSASAGALMMVGCAGPGHARRRARAVVAAVDRPRRATAGRSPRDPVGVDVLPRLGRVDRDHADGHLVALWHRRDARLQAPRRRAAWVRDAGGSRRRRGRADDHRAAVQARRGAVPRVDPGHVRRCAGHGRGFPVVGVQGRHRSARSSRS